MPLTVYMTGLGIRPVLSAAVVKPESITINEPAGAIIGTTSDIGVVARRNGFRPGEERSHLIGLVGQRDKNTVHRRLVLALMDIGMGCLLCCAGEADHC